MKYLSLLIILISCTSPEKINTLTIADRLQDGEKIILKNQQNSKVLHIQPNYDRNLGVRSLTLRDVSDPYNSIPILVLDKTTEEELLGCREPLVGDCLSLVETLFSRLDWPYVLVKSGDTLSAIAAKECGGSKNVSILRKYNFPYGECEGRADKKDQGLCLSISSGIPIRIPPACNF
jgi:hypothetical protein